MDNKTKWTKIPLSKNVRRELKMQCIMKRAVYIFAHCKQTAQSSHLVWWRNNKRQHERFTSIFWINILLKPLKFIPVTMKGLHFGEQTDIWRVAMQNLGHADEKSWNHVPKTVSKETGMGNWERKSEKRWINAKFLQVKDFWVQLNVNGSEVRRPEMVPPIKRNIAVTTSFAWS